MFTVVVVLVAPLAKAEISSWPTSTVTWIPSVMGALMTFENPSDRSVRVANVTGAPSLSVTRKRPARPRSREGLLRAGVLEAVSLNQHRGVVEVVSEHDPGQRRHREQRPIGAAPRLPRALIKPLE